MRAIITSSKVHAVLIISSAIGPLIISACARKESVKAEKAVKAVVIASEDAKTVAKKDVVTVERKEEAPVTVVTETRVEIAAVAATVDRPAVPARVVVRKRSVTRGPVISDKKVDDKDIVRQEVRRAETAVKETTARIEHQIESKPSMCGFSVLWLIAIGAVVLIYYLIRLAPWRR